jgi:hypothetical protein|tara:strand:- start:357 stop:1049 length:693 start_codon:yes stop_codon:yes gene_type:complete
MKNIKEKGFALILSLVLLIAMSLMGGSLILITSEDHKSNNLVDVEQQTFHVAEMALIEGERYLADQYQGPLEWDAGTQAAVRNLASANLPINLNTAFIGTMVPSTNGIICRNSFRNLPNNLQVIDLVPATAAVSEGLSFNFGAFLAASSIPTGNDQAFLNNFHYEYFITRLGAAKFRGAGSSAKRGSGGSGSGKNGMAFRIYGCGIYNPDQNAENQTVVTLESVVILPSS